ncbi:MAG: hypothetical protein ACREKS_22135 [Candidatus Rokuibacteriota bacterium]
MRKPTLAKVVRVSLLTLTVLTVAVLGMVGGISWAGGAKGAGTTGKSKPPVSGPCGLPDSGTAPAILGAAHAHANAKSAAQILDPVTRVLELSQSSAQLASAFNVANYSAELIAPELLPGSPVGWELIHCGIHTTSQSTSGLPVVLFRRGQLICFQIALGFSEYSIFYFDPTPTINRWVKLGTVVDLVDNEACTSPTFQSPGTFALFGMPQ